MSRNLLQNAKIPVKYWWLSVIIGVLALGLGVYCIFQPLQTLVAFTMLFVAGFFVVGLFDIILALSNREVNGWGWTLANGIIDIILGILLLSIPLSTPLVFVYYIGFWIMLQSFWGMGLAFDLQRSGISDWGWFLALAIFGFVFSLLFVMNPGFGGSVIILMGAAAFISYGIFRVWLGFKFKSFKKRVEDF